MTVDDLRFLCTRFKCRMTEASCIKRQQKAYRARHTIRTSGSMIYANEIDYSMALFCLSCIQGAQLRHKLKAPLKAEKPKKKKPLVFKKLPKPKPQLKPKPKPKIKPKMKPKPPIQIATPVELLPMCSVCHQYAARANGMCRACYNQEYRKARKA